MTERFIEHAERPPLIDVRARTNRIAERQRSSPSLPEGYRKRVGTALLSDGGKDRATMSFSSYSNKSRGNPDTGRPIAFIWNGGPVAPATSQMELLVTAPWVISHIKNDAEVHPEFIPSSNTPLLRADLVHVDPVGTGFGRVLPGEDPKRYFGMQQDIAAAVAFIEWYLQEYGYTDNPIILIGASFAAFRATGVALELQKRKRPVSAMSLIAGHYDYALQADRLEGVGDPKNPKIFATALPVMALTAKYCGRLSNEEQQMSSQELYKKVWEFASGTYLQNNRDNYSSEEIIEKLMHYTTLPRELITEDLRIRTDVFRENFFDDSTLSVLDSRFKRATPYAPNIDTTLDDWSPVYERLASQRLMSSGFPEQDMQQGYQGIIKAYPDWDFSGIWSDRSVHRAMSELLKEQPDLPIMHISGMYDFTTPPAAAELFWQDILESNLSKFKQYLQFRQLDVDAPIDRSNYFPDVNHVLLPVGHLPGINSRARFHVAKLLSQQAAYVRYSYKRQ